MTISGTNGVNFAASVTKWCRQSEQRMDAVFKKSTERVVEKADDYTPIDTGFLRASKRASTTEMPKIIKTAKPDSKAGKNFYSENADAAFADITLVISGATLGDVIYVGWTANYAAHQEFGTVNMEGKAFVGRAALQWKAIVTETAREARASVEGGRRGR